jgi:hypothetical protein
MTANFACIAFATVITEALGLSGIMSFGVSGLSAAHFETAQNEIRCFFGCHRELLFNLLRFFAGFRCDPAHNVQNFRAL